MTARRSASHDELDLRPRRDGLASGGLGGEDAALPAALLGHAARRAAGFQQSLLRGAELLALQLRNLARHSDATPVVAAVQTRREAGDRPAAAWHGEEATRAGTVADECQRCAGR